jgi:DNA polymerase family A
VIIDKILKTNNYLLMDIETDGLRDSVTKLHVFGYWHPSFGTYVKTTSSLSEVKSIIDSVDYLICHNGVLYDSIVLEDLDGNIDISFNSLGAEKMIDTLPISQYLYPHKESHSMDAWVEELGGQKPVIDDWSEQPIEVYEHRVIEDVKSQARITVRLFNDLLALYENPDSVNTIIHHLSFIPYCFKLQYRNPLALNVPLCTYNLDFLSNIAAEKKLKLQEYLPKVPVIEVKHRPQVMYKKDGSVSAHGVKWYAFLKELGAPEDVPYVKYIKSYNKPNAGAPQQIKDWLFSQGWEPTIFEDRKNTQGEIKKVPQIMDKDKNLCPNIVAMAKEFPAVKELVDLGVLGHRIGVLKGLLRNSEDGLIYGDIAPRMITNTLRVKHSRIVNLPKPSTQYGEYIRVCLQAPEGKVMIGTDMASLEAYTRTNLICDIDPSTIEQLLDPDFDAHLDLAIFAGLMTIAETFEYRNLKGVIKGGGATTEDIKRFEHLDYIRHNTKTVNYSALYKVGATKLAKQLKIKKSDAQKLLDGFWAKNYAVIEVENAAPTKHLFGTTWIYNHIVDVWFELRNEKDKFSSLNQGFGSVIFFSWLRECVKLGVTSLALNMHDEGQFLAPPNEIEMIKNKKQLAIDIVNKKYNLKVPIKIETKVGNNYAETH